MLQRGFVILMLLVTVLTSVYAQDATPEACPDTLPTRLSIGNYARVLPGSANRVRAEPMTSGASLGRIPGGGIFWVHDGPVCADGYTWWYAEYRGLNGWTAEGTGEEYWLEPVADEDAPVLNIEGLASVILFESRDQGHSKIYVADLSGTVSVSLTPPDVDDFMPRVSPDGIHIAFNASIDGEYRLSVMGFDGSFRRIITEAIPSSYTWSPDSQNLVLTIEEADPNSEMLSLFANLYLMSLEDSEPRALTSGLVHHSAASWSPDGAFIAYIVDGEQDSLWVLDMATGEERQLLMMDAQLGAPQWSPEGTGITLRASFPADPTHYQYFVVNPDGSNLRQPTGDGQNTDEFAWSPDGTRIVFVSGRTGNSQLYVVNADGSGLAQVTDTGCNINPSWSTDGEAIVFISNRDRERQNLCVGEVYVINADGTNLRRLTNNGRDNYAPQWVNIAPPLPNE